MPKNKQSTLLVNGYLRDSGITIEVENKTYAIDYPPAIWQQTPTSIQQALLENLTFGNTHYLPLILGGEKIKYNTKFPLLESFLFRNQLNDILICEKVDQASHLSYMRSFYNLEFEFNGDSTLPNLNEIRQFSQRQPKAVLPFTFGKESLTTFALCRELGIEPIIVYSQEPAHPYEETYKKKLLRKFAKQFSVKTYYIKNEPGLFRYGKAFNLMQQTEIGWGTQTTLLALLAIPFTIAEQAQYILIGSEYLNNEYTMTAGWKEYLSCDQTSFWMRQQNNIVRLFTNNNCQLKSSLEPLEEISIFSLLHFNYPTIGEYQFSCSGQKPLIAESQWCHACYKCARMYLFAACCGINPATIGFKVNLLKQKGMFDHYFGSEFATGSTQDLDFAFYILVKKKVASPYVDQFIATKLKQLKPWSYYVNYYTSLQPYQNLPREYETQLTSIFNNNLEKFKKRLPA